MRHDLIYYTSLYAQLQQKFCASISSPKFRTVCYLALKKEIEMLRINGVCGISYYSMFFFKIQCKMEINIKLYLKEMFRYKCAFFTCIVNVCLTATCIQVLPIGTVQFGNSKIIRSHTIFMAEQAHKYLSQVTRWLHSSIKVYCSYL